MIISYRESEDAALVRFAQDDDSRAFDELVRRYQSRVYRLSCGILRHEDDAAEALQDTFLSAYRDLKNFRAESTFSTWLFRIATNASLMKYHKRRGNHVSLDQPESQNGDTAPLQMPDWSAQPLEALLTAETRGVMEAGIQRLPVDLRTVFVLRDIERIPNAEVSAILELSVPAVKSRLHRGRVFLRDWMARYFNDQVMPSASHPTGQSPRRLGELTGRAAW